MSDLPQGGSELRVLVIDDDEDDFVLAREVLREMRRAPSKIQWASSAENGLQRLFQEPYDIVLVDYRLGARTGLDVIGEAMRRGSRTPAILLTGGGGRENLDIEALQAGAFDYMAKPDLNAAVLERAIRYAIERYRISHALRESEERFRLMANAIPVLIWIDDVANLCTFVNQSWLNFRGSTIDDELGDGWFKGVHPDDAGHLMGALNLARDKRTALETEFRLLRRDGEYRWMAYADTPFYMPNGLFTGYIGTCVDITARKTFEVELAEARDAALESARLKAQFLANMTHEIRTPMNGIIGMTDLLLRSGISPEQKELAETVRSSGQSLLRLINDILDFSRLDARRMTIERIPFNLLSLIEEATELMGEAARAKGIELICWADANLPHELVGDPGRLRQILMNLIGNAVKFTHVGEVIISASMAREDQENAVIRIDVSDSGIGISEEMHQKLFTAFVQADGTTTRKYGGTGLGLAISRELVTLMGGEITFESQLGKGSNFRVIVPLGKVEKGIESPYQSAGDISWQGRKALVIDDHAEARSGIRRMLSRCGMECAELANAENAVDLVKAEAATGVPFAVVFIEVDATALADVDLLRDLSAARGSSQFPRLVALSHNVLGSAMQQLKAAGADDFFLKPLRLSQILPLLFRLFSPSQTQPPRNPPQASRSAPAA